MGTLRFRLWLEADEDYNWFTHGSGQKRIKQMVGTEIDRQHWVMAYQHAQQQLSQADPTLSKTLKPDFLNMLLNYLAYLTYWRASYRPDDIENAIQSDNLTRVYGQFQNLVHANANNPKFFQSLQFVGPEGPAVSVAMLRNDTNTLARQGASGAVASRTGPTGRTLISFPDGHQWVALDKSFCELEGKAGRHCGNVMGKHEKNDQIISLRSPAGEVEATFVLNHGHLAESKGPGNQKLDPKFHPYVAQLFLATGPSPLPVVSNYFFYGNDGSAAGAQDQDGNPTTVNPRPLYQPHKDTTVLDLIHSKTLDDATKGKLIVKFRHELGDNILMSKYLDHEMDDDHRRKVVKQISASDPDRQFEKSKQRAADLALEKWGFMAPDNSQIANFQHEHESIIQMVDYTTSELKRLVGGRWMTLVERLGAKRVAADLEEFFDTLKDYDPKQFMYEFDPNVARRLQDQPHLADEGGEHDINRYHTRKLTDTPERRAMKKSLTKMFRVASQLSREILADTQGLENTIDTLDHEDGDRQTARRHHFQIVRNAEKIGHFVNYYLQRVK